MQYRYRWHYVWIIFASTIFLAYVCDIRPRAQALTLLHEEKNQLAQELSLLREASVHHPDQLKKETQSEWVNNLFLLAHESGITIQSINFMGKRPLEFSNLEMVRLVSSGDFSHLVSFLFLLTRQVSITLVTDFSYKAVQQDKFIFKADFLFWQDGINQPPLRSKNISLLNNPFCFTANQMPMQSDISILQQTPLAQIKIIGFIQQEKRKVAIVSLPNGVIADVKVGDVVGNKIVAKIERKKIVFK